jgi:nucleoside-diphosphate-sugar epimerase
MKVLVTGGGGFLGRHVVARLIARGDEVTTLARGEYPELGELGARALRGDVTDPADAREALRGQDAIVHTAARVGMWGAPEDFERVNVGGTQNLLDVARAEGVELFVYTSSPSVTFGGQDEVNVQQDEPYPDVHLNDYTRTKAEAERRVLAAHDPEGGLRTTSLRPHLIWGPGDPHLIPRVVARAKAGRLRIVGSGENVVDVTYVDNAAHAHVCALDALAAPECLPGGKPYYISNAEPVELWPWLNGLFAAVGAPRVTRKVPLGLAIKAGQAAELAWRMGRLDGEPPMTKFVALQLARSHWYDMEPARRDLGYEPLVSMDEGMERLIASMT